MVRQQVIDAVRKMAVTKELVSDDEFVDALQATRDEMRAALPNAPEAWIEDVLIANAGRLQRISNLAKANTMH